MEFHFELLDVAYCLKKRRNPAPWRVVSNLERFPHTICFMRSTSGSNIDGSETIKIQAFRKSAALQNFTIKNAMHAWISASAADQ
jgi:hypothetical protein